MKRGIMYNLDTSKCIQTEPAFCKAVCPFGLDVPDFIKKLQRGQFNSAYQVYADTVGFPEIIARLCPALCHDACIRVKVDASIDLHLLEQACVRYADRREPPAYNLPARGKRIAVIGAGLCGLSCALRLVRKGYTVDVYERKAYIGGQLWDLLPPEAFLPDIERQLANTCYALHLNYEIKSLSVLGSYDAIFISTDPNGQFSGKYQQEQGVFFKNLSVGLGPVVAAAHGFSIALEIEAYLKTGIMFSYENRTCQTRLCMNEREIKSQPKVQAGEDGFTSEQAQKEALRCMACSCNACKHHCDLMAYYQKYPSRIKDEVTGTIYPSADFIHRYATRLIASCMQCGLCKEICPADIDVGGYLNEALAELHRQKALPPIFHEFFLRDMIHANSEESMLCKMPDGVEHCQYLYFPGCQLGASLPAYVTDSYEELRELYPDTALLLRCCGIPAKWAGDYSLYRNMLVQIENSWEKFGRPSVIFGCPNCQNVLLQEFPEMSGQSLYSILADMEIRKSQRGVAAVYDPCAARYDVQTQNDVRQLALRAGYILQPLSHQGTMAQCCSWGGQTAIANPSMVKLVKKRRAGEIEAPYIAYCANCRDVLASTGKACVHILDLLFDLGNAQRNPPNATERRQNRVTLKHTLIQRFWNETSDCACSSAEMLEIPAALRQTLSDRYLLEEDIWEVIQCGEREGIFIEEAVSGARITHKEIGSITCWARYIPLEKGFQLLDGYSHRMQIVEDRHA